MMLRDEFRDSLTGVYICGRTDFMVRRSDFISAAELISSGAEHVFTKFFVSFLYKLENKLPHQANIGTVGKAELV